MTEACVRDFAKQAEEKSILLLHPHSDDLLSKHIGKLEESYITEGGEWKTVFRVWDGSDDVPTVNKEAAGDFWNQIRGEGPYGKPTRISQLSVQGLLNEEDVVNDSGKRAINRLELDAVAAVTRGAYPQDDFQTVEKVFKQFDAARKVEKGEVAEELAEQNFMRDFWDVEDATRSKLHEIMNSQDDPATKRARIQSALQEQNTMLEGIFEKANYSLPAEGEGEKMTPEEQPRKDEAPPPVEEKRKGPDLSSIAEALNQGAQMIAQAAQALVGASSEPDGDEPTGTVRAAAEGSDEEADKKKASDTAPISQVEPANVSEEEKSIRQAMKKLGLSDPEINRKIAEIRKSANPIAILTQQLEEQRKALDGFVKSVEKGFEEIASVTINRELTNTTPVKKAAAAPEANAPVQDAIPAGLQEWLKKSGYELSKKEAPGATPVAKTGDPDFDALPESIKKQYAKKQTSLSGAVIDFAQAATRRQA